MIKVIKDYYIDADAYGYAVKKYTGLDKEGKEMYTSIGYPNSIEDCLKFILRKEERELISNRNKLTFDEFLEGLREISESINRVVDYVKRQAEIKGFDK